MDRKSNNLFEVVSQGDEAALQRLLLERKEERNIATLAHGNTVLHEASWKGYSRCVKILCNVYPKDFDKNSNKEKLDWRKTHFVNRVNFCGFSALHLAAQNGHNQTLRELLYAGCSTSIHNDYGDTPLHTACRYGHAGVVRILISAKCDVDALNLNHDTPLHITCAMGRRKLTKLLLEAGAMQFQNLQHETPRDIAQRKNLKEILEIMRNCTKREDKQLTQESPRNTKSPNETHAHLLPHNSKIKYNNKDNEENTRNWSPYGCHYYPDTRNFPTPNLETLPKEPLQKGEQYYLDLGGNIRKGPVGKGNKCFCASHNNNSNAEDAFRNVHKLIDGSDEFILNKEMTAAISKHVGSKERHENSRNRERRGEDPLYPLLKIVGDKNKQMHLKKWLTKVHPDNESEGNDRRKEVAIDVHKELNYSNSKTSQSRTAKVMSSYDENGNQANNEDEDDENYTDISNETEDESGNGSINSNNGNCLYDESFLKNFQDQQIAQNFHQNESLTSPSVNSNQNIEMEMEKITKSLLTDGSCLMINRNPDVIKDHIHHSAKRSTKKIKSAITKPTASTILTSGDLYVNSFFTNEKRSEVGDEVDGIEDLISKVHSSIINSSNVSTVSSQQRQPSDGQILCHDDVSHCKDVWNQKGRSRNPLPLDINEIENYGDRIFSPEMSDLLAKEATSDDKNLVLLDQLLKARKKFNQTYQEQLRIMNQHEIRQTHQETTITNKNNQDFDNEFTIPSASTLV
ncbi:CLUMA_CG011179, isoform A [Clunio marinus]|uniref:CLUMA_CG011179, isoform A n=1 Tax=Clunio marinus TaxID=568069 RepID=A0A1J1IC41_9DIPT|nr:CLUMA_CG011179, isoform A [Clunio marinus]